MKILVLNGSPHTNGGTAHMIEAFTDGAESAGHSVATVNTAFMNVRGCMGCDYCRNQEKGVCVQKDDMQQIYPQILDADMIVFASPVYYFTMSAQLQAVIQRTYSIDIPQNVKKVALILSSGSSFVYGPAITQHYQSVVEYWKVENAGIFTAHGDHNKSEAKYRELYDFGRSLTDICYGK